MEIIAKIHEFDGDMVQLMSSDQKYLIGVVHIDNLFDLKDAIPRLNKGEELMLTVEIGQSVKDKK